MAEKLVSPGVFTRENDLSFIAQGVGAIGGAIVGPFKQGPAFKPTIITSPSELEDIFGAADGTYYTELTAQNYLRETGLVTICRVAGVGGYEELSPVVLNLHYSSSVSIESRSVGILFSTTPENSISEDVFTIKTQFGNGNFVLSGSVIGTVSSSLDYQDPSDIEDVFGVSPLGSKAAYVYGFFKNNAKTFISQSISSSQSFISSSFVSASFTILDNQNFNSGSNTDVHTTTAASTPWIKTQLIGNERFDLLRFHTLADGNIENTRFKIEISNIKPAGSNNSDYGTFSVIVRSFDDTDKNKVILEQFNNVNLDSNSNNYIARVIGDKNITIDETGKLNTTGDWNNKSKYIRIEVKDSSLYPVVSVPYAHDAYSLPISASSTISNLIPAVTYTSASLTASYCSGIDLTNIDNKVYLKPIPNGAGTGVNSIFGLDLFVPLTGSIATDVSKRSFIVAFQGGFDGMSPATEIKKGTDIDQNNTQGFDLSTSAAVGSLAYKKCLDALSNTDEWDINLLVLPGVNHYDHSPVTQYAMDICENRADTFYIMDPAGQSANIARVVEVAESLDTNYAAVYYPWLKTIDTNTGRELAVPPSVLLPRVYAANDATAAEWFAPAGLNRGGVIGATAVLNRLTHAERDELYEGKVNPIAQFPGQGISAFGQKTLQSRPSALDRINVRRLLITVKKFIASTSRFLVFEQNTTDTRNKFLNTVSPYLESIQQRQGLYAFRVVMDDSNNTPDVIDRNILKGAIFLQPTKTAEFIQIDFNVLPTGASFNA
jgi:hypothetical protein